MKFEFKSVYKSAYAQRFGEVSLDQWSDWTWHMRNCIKTQDNFEQFFHLTEEERFALKQKTILFNQSVTPYYASLVAADDLHSPLRRIMIPHSDELKTGLQSQLDPLGEKKQTNNPVSRVIHRYSDRALFLVTDLCSVYCRYCTRKHFTGQNQVFPKKDEYQEALDYFKNHKGIREVILSGGDPLTLSDAQIDKVLSDLRSIDHIEIIRIGSRMPVVLPQRITDQLVQIIKRHKPVFLMTHFNHPKEITMESANALEKCVDHGIPVFNQTVLLNGVNNHASIIQALSRRLMYLRVKPYYMFQCDPSEGTDYLRTSIDDSLLIQKELWGHMSGLALPQLSVDIPNGGGKAYYVPSFEKTATSEKRTFVGWDGVQAEYLNPSADNIKKPSDISEYEKEWTEIKTSKASFDV